MHMQASGPGWLGPKAHLSWNKINVKMCTTAALGEVSICLVWEGAWLLVVALPDFQIPEENESTQISLCNPCIAPTKWSVLFHVWMNLPYSPTSRAVLPVDSACLEPHILSSTLTDSGPQKPLLFYSSGQVPACPLLSPVGFQAAMTVYSRSSILVA